MAFCDCELCHNGLEPRICDCGKPTIDEKIAELREKIVCACAGSCTCHTKSPCLIFHFSSCRYRVLMECYEFISGLRS